MRLSSGTECCMFHIIPGTLAKTTSPQEVGRAAGQLCSAMADVKLDIPSATPPYYELYKVHHAVTRDLFFQVRVSQLVFAERTN